MSTSTTVRTPRIHFIETRDLASKLNTQDIGEWLVKFGYFPEQYVLPPCFTSEAVSFRRKHYFPLKPRKKSVELKPDSAELVSISFPKSALTHRFFAILDPRHHHDLVCHLVNQWQTLIAHLFHPAIGIYSYSFPIPLTREAPGQVGNSRAGRMIYEFLEMAENGLVTEAHRYSHIVKTDIANFYASIYTHSIAWALHGKPAARTNRNSYDLLGKILDRLVQNANDHCTNGLPVGPAISDLISEIILAAVDRDCSERLEKEKIDYVGVRFKDDYRFLCHSEEDAKRILSVLQQSMRAYNLTLNEAKSITRTLPEGIYREWTSDYHQHSLRFRRRITYRRFEKSLLAVLAIDQEHPGTGAIDRFISELTSKKRNLKLGLRERERPKTVSLLLLLRKRRPRSFPAVLAVIEAMLEAYAEDKELRKFVRSSLKKILDECQANVADHEYEILWIIYFLKTVLKSKAKLQAGYTNLFLESLVTETQFFFSSFTGGPLFQIPSLPVSRNHLLRHLAIFQSRSLDDEQDEREDEPEDG